MRFLNAFDNKAHLAQLVGADEAEHNIVDAHAFLEGLCAECLEEHEANKAVTLEDIAHTEEEALNLVSGSALSQGRHDGPFWLFSASPLQRYEAAFQLSTYGLT